MPVEGVIASGGTNRTRPYARQGFWSFLASLALYDHEAALDVGLYRSQHRSGRLRRLPTCSRSRQLRPGEWAEILPSLVHVPDLVALHTQHPADVNAPGTLPLNSPILQGIQAKWPDPRSFISQATPRQLATYGFTGEPAYSGAGASGPHSPDDPEDIVVFHGNWSANEVNMHGYGHGGPCSLGLC